MINSINNINFKAIIKPKDAKLTAIQEKIIDDITIKLGEKGEEKNFLVQPIENDTIELLQINNKQAQNNQKQEMSNNDYTFIGMYNKYRSFDIGDFQRVCATKRDELIETITICIMTLVTLAAGTFIAFNRSDFFGKKPPVEEMFIKKDSVQVVKDSLKIFK